MLTNTMKEDLIHRLIDIFSSNILAVILYGSVARNDNTDESDIDIAIIVKNEMDDATKEWFIRWSTELDLRYDRVFSIIDIQEENMEKCGMGGSNMNYYISDLHLFHEAAIRFDDRPFRNLEEMHAEIVKRWNEKVNNGDTAYILGDVSMRGKNEDLIALVAILKGKKVLIRGNHDDVSDLRYRQLFSEVCDYKEIRDSIAGKSYELVLCHYPIFSWKHMSRGTILLYGHTHNSPEDDYFQKCLAEMKDNDCRHIGDSVIQAYNVGCMKPWMDYEPRSLQEIIKMKFVENGN